VEVERTLEVVRAVTSQVVVVETLLEMVAVVTS
jgi:hypothetical protein